MIKRLLLAVRLVVTITWLVMGGWATAGARTTAMPADGFETGNDAAPPADWDTQIVVRGQCEMVLDAEIFTEGTGSYRADKVKEAATTCYVTKTQGLGQTGPYQRHTFYLRISAWPGGATHVWGIRTIPYASQSLVVHPDGRLSIANGPNNTAYDSGSRAIRPGLWYEVRFDVHHHDTMGEFTLWVNGVPWVAQSGIDTKAAAFDAFSVRAGILTAIKDTMDVYYDHYRWRWAATPFPKEGSPAPTPTRLFRHGGAVYLPLAIHGP